MKMPVAGKGKDERHPKMEKKYTAGFKTLMVFHTQRVLVLMLG